MEDEQVESFSASPEVAAKILAALGHAVEEDDVTGFAFGEIMPRVEPGKVPLRPKDGGTFGSGPTPEASWTAWNKVG